MPLLTLLGTAQGPRAAVRAKALVFEDPLSRALLATLQRIGPSEETVLITGETGTGKEIVARHLHDLGARRDRPFVAVNCGAISESLFESELFGHERGAFTGATLAQPGWFEAAHGGTLFLDELGELPPAAQVKLLRVLQEREVVRVGSRRAIPVDVRVIAATNADLVARVAEGRFRADLFYRVNVTAVHAPPLRERPGDIMPLARHFLALHGGAAAALTPDAAERLVAHDWPGNIRELENVVRRALVVCGDGRIAPEDLSLAAREAPAAETATTTGALEAALLELFELAPDNLHARIEEAVMRTAYRYCDRNQLETSRLLGISRNIVRARLLSLGELSSRRTAPAR